MAAASTLLAFAIGGVVDLDPFSLNLWSAQAAAREAAKPTTTAEELRQDALDLTADQNAAEQAAAAKVSQQEATTLGGAGTTAPPIGVPDKDKTPALSPRDAAIETAQRQAQTSQQPVVVDALTTETALTTAMPDGTMRTQTSLGPVRYRTDGGTGADLTGKASWKDLDLALTGQDGSGRTTAEAAGPWAARLAGESGAGMVAVGPAGQTITWSPQAVTGPVGVGGPGGALPAVKPTAPTTGVTPVQSGVDVQVVPDDAPALPGSGADAPQPVVTPTAQASTKSANTSGTSSRTSTATSSGASSTSSPRTDSSVRLKSTTPEPSTPPAPSSAPSASAADSGTEADADAGSDAVFPGVLKGGRDYTVTVTATGAEESVVLASREQVTAAGGAAAAAVYRNTFTLPAGVTARQASAQGGVDPTTLGVEFVDASGAVIATFGGGKAVDSSANEVGEPATAPVATRLLAVSAGTGTGAGSATGSVTGSATVEVSVDPAWVADSARVFPLTIDPHIATGTSFSGSTGPNGSNNFDAYVDEAFPTVNEGVQDSGRLLAGYRPINGANKASTTLVYFNLGDLIGSENTITSAQFSVWNNYSYSCTPSGLWVDAATGSWNPATVTWNTRPGWANAGSMKTFAHGYSSSCAAAAEFYDVTGIVQKWANGTTGYYPGLTNYGFILTANGTDVNGYKRFNSAETGSGMPGLTVSWENCTNYPAGAGGSGTRKVCGAIRDDYAANGGPSGFGLPTTNDAATPNGKGFYNHFDKNGEARSIYWNQTTGAHSVGGAIRTRWAADGYETSPEGWPASDYKLTPSGQGYWNLFYNLDSNQYRYIYSSSATGTRLVQGYIGAKWDQQGREGVVGWPETEEVNAPGNGGRVTYFRPLGTDGAGWSAPGNPSGRSGGIYFKTGTTAAWPVHGRIFEVYRDLGETSSWLGYPQGDEYHPTYTPGGAAAPTDAKQSNFENGVIYGDPRNGYTAVLKPGAASMPMPSIDQHTARRLPLQVVVNAPLAVDPDTKAPAVDWPSRLNKNPIVQYRRGAKAATGTAAAQKGSAWTTIDPADLYWPNTSTVASTTAQGKSMMVTKTVTDSTGKDSKSLVLNSDFQGPTLYWDAGKTLAGVPGLLDVRFVFTDSTGATLPVSAVGGVEYDPNAGQSGTTAAGPGSVNLLTGAYDLSATDVSAFGVSISRTASSRLTTAGTENIAGSPFGPQWAMGGVDEDLDLGWTSLRQTSDYSLDLLDASGQSTSFAVDEAGTTWYPESGEEDLKLIGSTTDSTVNLALTPFKATSWTLTDGDGTTTVFENRVAITAPSSRREDFAASAYTQSTWQVTSTAPASGGSINATRYGYSKVTVSDRNDSSKTVDAWRLWRVGAANPALPAGSQGLCLTAATPGAGCRVLQLNWTGNDASARVNSIDLYATDPTSPTSNTTPSRLSTYVYDTAGRLTSVTDRANLTTRYTYAGDYTATSGTTSVTVPGPVASLTPERQQTWTFEYDTNGTVTSAFDVGQVGAKGRLLRVSRPNLQPDGTTTTATPSQWDVVYGVPLDTSRFGPYPMSAGAVVTWGQDVAPLDATAVYGPNAASQSDVRTGTHDASQDSSARNWAPAAVTYMDVNGHTVNVAQPSSAAGRWVPSGTATSGASTAAKLSATTDPTIKTRNSTGQPGAGLAGGSSPATDVVAIPAKGARISAAIVDAAGNTTFSLTAGNRALALGQDDDAAISGGADNAATQLTALSQPSDGSTPDVAGSPTWLRAQLLSTQTRYELSRSTFVAGPQLREPTQVAVTSLQPLRLTITKPASNGSADPVPARAVTYTEYDGGRQDVTNPQASELPTKVTTGFVAGTSELLDTKQVIRYRDTTVAGQPWTLREESASYAGVSGLTTAKLRPIDAGGPVHDVRYVETQYAWTGAAAGKPTWVRTSAATGDATETRTNYDALGRVIAASMPRNPGDTSATGTASTTVTRYYGDGSNGTNNCTTASTAAAVVFGGMVCSTGPANVQGLGGSPGLPTSTTTYTRTGLPAAVTETLTPASTGTTSTLRTTITGYDSGDRPTTVTTTTYAALNVAAGTEVKSLTYDDQGNPNSTSDGGSSNVANGRTLRTTYDTLGRVMSSTDATGLKTDTTYDTSGRVATTTVTDTNTSSANTGAAAVTGYSAVTAGKMWKQTNTYDPITGDLTGTTDEAPSGQAAAGAMSVAVDLDGRTVSTTTTGSGSGYTKKTVFDTTGAAVRRTVIAGGQTVLDDANAATLTSNGGGENVYGQQVESTQQLKAITRNSAGDPSGTTASTTTRHRRYSYDGLGRLVAAADSRLAPTPNAMSCTVRAWAYDPDSNQIARASTPTSSSGPCAATGYTVPSTSTAGGNALNTHSMNALDQITDGGYSYDGLGRTLTVPNGNGNLPDKTTVGINGALSVTYAPGDMVASQTLPTGSGNEVQTFTLDPTGDRLLSSTTTLPGQSATAITNRYNDTDDNPVLINEADGTVSRYVAGPDADLTASITLKGDGTSGLSWQVINLHGDIVATVPGGTSATATAAVMTDEFGVVLDTTPGQNNTATSRYDWLGGKQRSGNARAGLTLMGVRLYNPATGRFASVDPIPGGNANAYTYPSDPVNTFDADGRASKGRKLWRWVKKNRGTIFSVGATLTCLVPGVGWAACAVAQGVAYGVRAQQRAADGGGWRKTARANALDGIFTFASGGLGQVAKLARFSRVPKWWGKSPTTQLYNEFVRGSKRRALAWMAGMGAVTGGPGAAKAAGCAYYRSRC